MSQAQRARGNEPTPQRRGEQPQGWKRWVRIGPGFVVALIIAITLVVFQARMRAPQGPPIVERQVQPSGLPGAGTYPQPRFLLERRDRLHLTPAQVSAIERVQAGWEQQTASDRRSLEDETRRLNDFLSASQNWGGQVPMPEVQQRAGPVSALSGALAASRYQAWQKALSVLAQQQRRAQAEGLRKAEARPGKDT